MTTKILRRSIAHVLILLLSLVIFESTHISSVNAQRSGIDLALTINGSGSISAADFVLQKEGIKAALQNPDIVPRDGSIAVTIVQYANGRTEVHVPYTVINSQADVNNILAQTNSIVQISGSTNPGDGINRAMEVLNFSGNSSHQQVICLSTDGLPNSGADVATALNNAKNSSIVLDRFSVIAIEDPPTFFETDFQNFYGSLVFDGAVTVARNSTEYANILGATCLPTALELVGLEVNQAIQDWNNSIQLISGKTTIVRAYLQTKDSKSAPAIARLRGFRNGTELAESPLTAINATFTAPSKAINPQDLVNRRTNIDQSLNFRLPPSWLNNAIDLRVEGVGGQLDCMEPVGTPNDCSIQVSFNTTNQLKVKFVRVSWVDLGGIHQPSSNDINLLANRLKAIYPVAEVDATTGQLTSLSIGSPNLKVLNFQLQVMRFVDCLFTLGQSCDRIYYGNIVDDPGLGGLANGIPGTVASGDMGAEPHVHAHEIGHLLGRHHAINSSLGTTPGSTIRRGPCGSATDDSSAPDFPHIFNINGIQRATIGPMNSGDHTLVFGLNNAGSKPLALSPFQNFELMSYCQPLWISDLAYNAIKTEIDSRFTGSSASIVNNVAQEYMIFNGLIDLQDNSVEFKPFSIVPDPLVSPPVPSPGEYMLQLIDETGNLVTEIAFEPIEQHAFGGPDPNTGIFIIAIPANPEIQQAQVLHNGSNLGTVTASPNPPTVEVTFPNGGESLNGAQTTLTWAANDPDGDVLTYRVEFSRDGGSTWETLVTDWPEETYDIALSFLGETNSGLIQVVASDGFNAVADRSDSTFSTPNVAPQASILSPADKDIFVGVQSIFFEGLVTDREDGKLTGNRLAWSSNLNGALGTGEILSLEATELSEGVHTITLTATDSGGLSVTVSVPIQIYRLAADVPRADLVIQEIVATESSIEVIIKNQGDGPVLSGHDFWVDVYINPNTPPIAVNDVWDFMGNEGLVWGVVSPAVPIQPGDTVTLTIGDSYYWPSLSNVPNPIPPGTPIYAQVDSANSESTYGGVLESHELGGGAYNNIVGPVLSKGAESSQLNAKLYLPLITSSGASAATDSEAMPAESINLEETLPVRP